jgi:hypothetical protein
MIGPLFHWSPADRFESIRLNGLRPGQPPTVASGSLHYICASPDPRAAWVISGAVEWCAEVEHWDLWLIHLQKSDELHVRPFFGTQIEEIKIRNPISADRLWWVGRRDIASIPGELLPTC